MSFSDAVGQVDQIVQWEQQLANPAALTQTSTGGTAATDDTSSTSASDGSSSASFANALADAQTQDGSDAVSALDSSASGDTSTDGTTGASDLLSGGDSQLLTALSSLPGSSSTTAGSSSSDPRVEAMVDEANSLLGKPYVWGGGHDGWAAQSGYDCSGFVSAVLHAGGYLSSPQDTTTLPSAAGIESGPGQYVTIYDRDSSGQQGHVIIDLGGQFYESGGEQGSWGGGGGVEKISTPSASYLATFNQVLHPAGL